MIKINNNNIYQKALNYIKTCGPLYPKCCCVLNTSSALPNVTLSSILVDNDNTQTVTTNELVNLGEQINVTGSAISYSEPSIVNLENPGTYYILYSSLISNTGTAGSVGASLLVNGVVVSNASEYIPASTTQSQFVLQHSVTITSPVTVSIQNGSTVSNDFHDSSLSIIKLA